MTATLPLGQRGRLLDRFGKPMKVLDLAHEFRRQVKWTQRHIDILVELGWLIYLRPTECLPGEPVVTEGSRTGHAGSTLEQETEQTEVEQETELEKKTTTTATATADSSPTELVKPVVLSGNGDDAGKVAALLRANFDAKTARQMAGEYTEDEIREAVTALDRRLSKPSPLGNPQGYFRATLQAIAKGGA